MHQSGTHWLKFILANALAARYAVPGPQYNHANDIIGGPKDLSVYPQLPRLISSHSIPPLWIRNPVVLSVCKLPRFCLLVRDIRRSLISNYAKWRDRYGVSFSCFLRGDPAGERYNSDLWWCIRFLNAWGRMGELQGDNVLVVHYEAMQSDTVAEVAKVSSHFGLDLSGPLLEDAVAKATKETMRSRSDPARPPGEVSVEERQAEDWFSAGDDEYLRTQCRRFLRYDFGYGY